MNGFDFFFSSFRFPSFFFIYFENKRKFCFVDQRRELAYGYKRGRYYSYRVTNHSILHTLIYLELEKREAGKEVKGEVIELVSWLDELPTVRLMLIKYRVFGFHASVSQKGFSLAVGGYNNLYYFFFSSPSPFHSLSKKKIQIYLYALKWIIKRQHRYV